MIWREYILAQECFAFVVDHKSQRFLRASPGVPNIFFMKIRSFGTSKNILRTIKKIISKRS
jgi:hypothetical protein